MGNEDEQGRNGASSDQDDADGETCAYCGAAIDRSEWYPVTTERDATDSLVFYYFCSADCQAAWLDESSD